MSNRVTHFEIPAANPGECMEFYSSVFGWQFRQFGTEPYWLAISGNESTPGINGAIMKEIAPGQPVVNTITVDDIDAMLEKVVKHGGRIHKPKWAIPSVGWLAFVADPQGNMHGIMQADPNVK
jgi:uncharacterized protein